MRGFLLTAWCLTSLAAANEPGVISGRVLNGTVDRQPLADTEVVLRAGSGASFSPIATVTTDENGRFAFANLASDGRVIFLPGANRHGVHFPGPRLRLNREQPSAEVELVAYDAVEDPSPLVARRHELAIRVETGFLEIAETLAIENPSRTAYVGESDGDRPPVTLRLQLPPGFETVTFDQEFLGRSFLIHENTLATDLPWPPGSREIKFTYRLPVEATSSVLRRVLDLPTDQVTIRVSGADPKRIACDLPTTSGQPGEITFAQRGTTLAAGHVVELRLGDLPVRWETYGRWGTVVVLGLLLSATLVRRRRSVRPAHKPAVATSRS